MAVSGVDVLANEGVGFRKAVAMDATKLWQQTAQTAQLTPSIPSKPMTNWGA